MSVAIGIRVSQVISRSSCAAVLPAFGAAPIEGARGKLSRMRPLSAKDLDRLCRLTTAGNVGLPIPHARRGRWIFALKRGLARWGSTPPRNMGEQLLYPRRIYVTDLGRTLAAMCP